MIFTRPGNWVALDLNISNGQQDNHVILVLEVRGTFMLTKNIIKFLGNGNRLFNMKEVLHLTQQQFIRISGSSIGGTELTPFWTGISLARAGIH